MVKQTFLNLPEGKKKRIIEVAIEEFALKPYSKASLTNIVKRAGIAKGSMYQYFRDKEGLYRYLLELAAQEKLAFIREAEINADGDIFEILEKIMLAGIQFNLSHPQLSRVFANAMETSGEEIIRDFVVMGRQMSHKYFKELLSKGQTKGDIRADLDVGLAAHLLTGVLGEGLTNHFLDVLGMDMRELAASPELVKSFPEGTIKSTVQSAINFIKAGIGAKG